MIIVDGGYLAWCYGPNVAMHRAWTAGARESYSRRAGAIICLDAAKSWRALAYLSYKMDRKKRNASDPSRQEKANNVVKFIHGHLIPDPSIHTIRQELLEADDLVAMMVLLLADRKEKFEVIGTDKDLLQIPRPFLLTRKDGEEVTIGSYAAKAPKRIGPLILEPKHVLLDLCVRGDSSDSIPPAIPPRRLEIAEVIFRSDKPFSRGYELLGEPFLRNLILALLPGPICYGELLEKEEYIDLADSGEYWERPLGQTYLEGLLHEVAQSHSSISEVF